MLFNSFEFPLFFLLVTTAYFFLPFRFRWALLLAASYLFYMAWRPEYVLLLLISTAVDYWAGLGMGRYEGKRGRGKYLAVSLGVNLGLLFAFKYFNFFMASAEVALVWARLPYLIPHLSVLLPVGISFYTFQTLSYTFEVYRGKQKPERHAGRFALYVAFFPQLVAGPIERPQRLLPQLALKVDFDYARVRSGLALMLWGLFKKVVIADRLATVADFVYANPERCPGVFLVIGTVFFTFQIYCDFSGYSDIAIGAARVLGVDLMKNFNRPFAAASIGEYWRRWHISLSSWFRDYMYTPLGGNRSTGLWWALSIMLVFLVSGLWHGANWTFVVWGALHGTYYLVGRYTASLRDAVARGVGLARTPRLRRCMAVSFTFALLCLGFVIFRSASISDAVAMLSRMPRGWLDLDAYGGFSEVIFSMDLSVRAFWFTAGLTLFLLVVEKAQGEREFSELLDRAPVWLRWGVYAVLGFAVLNLGVAREIPFVYYQF